MENQNPVAIPVGELATNCYILHHGEEGVVIDPGDDGARIVSALSARRVTPVLILLTHGHFDHIGEAAALRGKYGCPIGIGAGDAGLLGDVVKNLAGDACGGRFCFSADRLYKEGDAFAAGGMTFHVMETPGHTQGGVCYRCGGMLFCGDTLFRGGYGRTDFYGGDSAALRASLRRLAELPPETLVYPGHGASTDIAAERRGNPALGMMDDDGLY